jgi:hypothetical protein
MVCSDYGTFCSSRSASFHAPVSENRAICSGISMLHRVSLELAQVLHGVLAKASDICKDRLGPV